ncbi:MAG: beta-N-acetylhexosaminidase [Acidobacteriaceae bacterium]|nr:beta-N-acetylhexosaminidase [Acidobacteriaceae bacterium]
MSRLRCRGFHFAGLVAVLSVSPLFAQRMVGLEPKKPDPIAGATKVQERWVDRTLRHLTLEEKIGQMIEVRGIMGYYNANDPGFEKLIADIRKYHLGAVHLTVNTDGPLLVRTEPYEAAMTVRGLQQEAHGKVPLIFSVDFERGPSMRLSAVEYFPHPMAFGATHNPAYVEQWGKIVAEESRSLGIAWNFFPIADVQINPKNPIINTRSFGEDPTEVSAMVSAYIKGSHAGGMLTALKHFPGHGDTDTDSHLQLSRVNAPMERLNEVELPPFQKGIAAGTDAVMIAHVAFPAIEPDPGKIATTSRKVVTGLLREQMGFKGVIVSDAMEMQGLTKLYPPGSGNPAGRAAVDAVKAGQDFLELPSDLDGTYNGLLQAVKSGEIPQSQIEASVRRLLLVKAKAGLDSRKGQVVDLDQVQQHFGKPSSYALAQEVAEHAITLVRDDNHLLPMRRDDGRSTLVVLFVSDPHGDDGRTLEQQIRARLPGATVVYVDRRSAPFEADGIAAMLPGFGRVIAAIYSVPQPGQVGTQTSLDTMSAAKETAGTILQRVLDLAGERTVVLAMGSPYLILSYPNIQSYACAFSSVSTSEIAMVRALFGEIPIHGKLPVTLPNVAKRGDGMDMSLSAASLGLPRVEVVR